MPDLSMLYNDFRNTDEQIHTLFDELDAMQHRVDVLTEKVEQLVADMEDIARVFGTEGR